MSSLAAGYAMGAADDHRTSLDTVVGTPLEGCGWCPPPAGSGRHISTPGAEIGPRERLPVRACFESKTDVTLHT